MERDKVAEIFILNFVCLKQFYGLLMKNYYSLLSLPPYIHCCVLIKLSLHGLLMQLLNGWNFVTVNSFEVVVVQIIKYTKQPNRIHFVCLHWGYSVQNIYISSKDGSFSLISSSIYSYTIPAARFYTCNFILIVFLVVFL